MMDEAAKVCNDAMNMFGPNNPRPSCGNAAESLAGDVYNLAGQIDPSYYNLANGIRVICGDSGTEPTDSNADSSGPLHRMCEESANNFPEAIEELEEELIRKRPPEMSESDARSLLSDYRESSVRSRNPEIMDTEFGRAARNFSALKSSGGGGLCSRLETECNSYATSRGDDREVPVTNAQGETTYNVTPGSLPTKKEQQEALKECYNAPADPELSSAQARLMQINAFTDNNRGTVELKALGESLSPSCMGQMAGGRSYGFPGGDLADFDKRTMGSQSFGL